MNAYLLITVTAPDRPGIVERITEQVTRYDANWEDSRMARLGGDFAGIVKLSVAKERVEKLAAALRELTDDETTIVVKEGHEEPTEPPPEQLYELRLSGADHEGIVHSVAAHLAQQGINLESMDTHVVPAPMSASPLFQMGALIKISDALTLEQLRGSLRQIGDDLGVDIDLRAHNQ